LFIYGDVRVAESGKERSAADAGRSAANQNYPAGKHWRELAELEGGINDLLNTQCLEYLFEITELRNNVE